MHALSLRNWCKSSRCCTSSLSLNMTGRHAHTVERTNQTPRNPYPYPAHRNPTPHQIFHLPHSASDADIKARYYDLVRLYHPDKAAALLSTQISADEAHARFRAITAAYDALRRKTALNGLQPSAATTSMANQYQTTAAYRAMQRKRQELYDSGAVDDSRTDRLLIAGIVATILFVVVHNLTTRREVIAESISRSRIIGGQTQSQRIRESEERLSMAAVDQVHNK